MTKYRIWATDCDGPGDIRYAPLCDTEEEAQAWIDNFLKNDPEDITDIWIEEEDDEDFDPTPYGGFDYEPMTMGMSEHDPRL